MEETRRRRLRLIASGNNNSAGVRDSVQTLPGHLQPVMAYAPLAATGVTEQARGREEEPAPALHPQRGLAAIDLAKHAFDLVAMRIEIFEPVLRGALIVHAAPAPL